MNKVCDGCGSIIQCVKPNIEGYVKPEYYNKSLLCERCFKIKNYGKSYLIDKKQDMNSFIEEINKTYKPVLFIVDIMNINNNIMNTLKLFKNKIYLVITKRDLIPKSVKDKKLIKYINDNYFKDDVFIVSSEKMYEIDNLYNKLINDKVRTCYLVGYTNAGKSTLINSLLKSKGLTPSVTTSPLPNTTLEQINIKLSEELTIIDTPGIYNDNSIVNYIDINLYKKLIPKKEIKPKIHTIKPGFMVIIDSILRIENNTKDNFNMIFYISNNIILDKMRIERNNKLKILSKINLNVKEGEDIVIDGLGFIKNNKDAYVNMYVVDNKVISLRNKMI